MFSSAPCWKKLKSAVNEGFILDRLKERVYISLSIGVAHYPINGTTFSDVLKCADTALYEAKSRGGDDYIFYQEIEYSKMGGRAYQ
ncbi:diguanylate cyclase [Acerihabitans sp. KWT182]|uniref:Diguanylate cyclase n=1 Tax=Acerihabitans sp. KWT182 TaxID=3157919 RepID=A0AAU7Q642_9GAMM